MKIIFKYDKGKDIWCLLNKGKSSINSQYSTKQYEQLVELYGENISNIEAASFINKYLSEKEADIVKSVESYQKDWETVSEFYTKRAEQTFGVSLMKDVIAYLTINSRCPYSLEENYFFVTVPTYPYVARKTVMHELWHFYTWYAFGKDQEEKLGKEKYNNLKEALTVLINVIYKDLLPKDVVDNGYPQHSKLRAKIIELWKNDNDIRKLWSALINE